MNGVRCGDESRGRVQENSSFCGLSSIFFFFFYISNRYSRVLNMLLVEGVVNDAYATFLCVFILISSH